MTEPPQTDLPARADDDMVVQGQPKHTTSLLDLLRHSDVRLRRLGIARRMIVDEDQGRSIEVQGAPDDFARIDRHMIDSADAKAFVGNEPVLAVQVQDMKPLDIATHREGIMPKSA